MRASVSTAARSSPRSPSSSNQAAAVRSASSSGRHRRAPAITRPNRTLPAGDPSRVRTSVATPVVAGPTRSPRRATRVRRYPARATPAGRAPLTLTAAVEACGPRLNRTGPRGRYRPVAAWAVDHQHRAAGPGGGRGGRRAGQAAADHHDVVLLCHVDPPREDRRGGTAACDSRSRRPATGTTAGRAATRASPPGPQVGVGGGRRPPAPQPFLGRSLNGVFLSGPGSLGSPSTRSPMMLRWIWSVPP